MRDKCGAQATALPLITSIDASASLCGSSPLDVVTGKVLEKTISRNYAKLRKVLFPKEEEIFFTKEDFSKQPKPKKMPELK
jgi:hypothetical protein